MSGFDPGVGWHEVPNGAEVGQEYLIQGIWPSPVHVWVREEPVPPLPTKFGTVITIGAWRFVFMDAVGGSAWFLLCANTYEGAASMALANVRAGAGYSPEFVRAQAAKHGGFEVLSEPRPGAVKRAEESARRLTAKAVLDRVCISLREQGYGEFRFAKIAREFGASDD